MAELGPRIREVARSLDEGLPPPEIDSLDTVRSRQMAEPRFYLMLFGAFAAVGFTLAVVGVYSICAYAVSRRTNEFAIRLALGARPVDIIHLIARSGLVVTLGGAAVGSVVALIGTRLLSSLVYDIKTNDPLTFACMAAVLSAFAVSASYLAALPAQYADPIKSLKSE